MPKKPRSTEDQEAAPIAARTRRKTLANTPPPLQLRSRSVAPKRKLEELPEPQNRKKAGTRSASRAPRRAAAGQEDKTHVKEETGVSGGTRLHTDRAPNSKDTPAMPGSNGTGSGEDMDENTGHPGDQVRSRSGRGLSHSIVRVTPETRCSRTRARSACATAASVNVAALQCR